MTARRPRTLPRAARAPFMAEVAGFLASMYGVRRIGSLDCGAFILDGGMSGGQDPVPYCQRGYWTLSDNGGEFNVAKINGETFSVPYDADDSPSAATTALRCFRIINGQEIDWDAVIEEAVAACYA